jgi:hypothetical protein
MKPTKVLPDDYLLCYTLDSSQHKIAQGILFVLGAGAFLLCLQIIRIEFPGLKEILRIGKAPHDLIEFFITIVTFILLHENIHGLVLWFFTKEWPAFGINTIGVYVNASEWYLPRNPMIIMSLSPLCLLSIIGILIFSIAPGGLLRMTLWATLLNAAGSVNDLAVATWIFFQPGTVMIKNSGRALSIYKKRNDQVHKHGIIESVRIFMEQYLIKLP